MCGLREVVVELITDISRSCLSTHCVLSLSNHCQAKQKRGARFRILAQWDQGSDSVAEDNSQVENLPVFVVGKPFVPSPAVNARTISVL